MLETGKKDIEKASKVKKTARLHGVTTDYVRKILRGDRHNEDIFGTYMTLMEKEKEAEAEERVEIDLARAFSGKLPRKKSKKSRKPSKTKNDN